MSEKTIYDLELHEEIRVLDNGSEAIFVSRVPGGWLYQSYFNERESIAFVPYNDEFKPKE